MTVFDLLDPVATLNTLGGATRSCIGCGYQCDGNTRCPECGLLIGARGVVVEDSFDASMNLLYCTTALLMGIGTIIWRHSPVFDPVKHKALIIFGNVGLLVGILIVMRFLLTSPRRWLCTLVLSDRGVFLRKPFRRGITHVVSEGSDDLNALLEQSFCYYRGLLAIRQTVLRQKLSSYLRSV